MPYKWFAQSEQGVATVDWVVVAAVLVGLGFAITATVSPSMSAQNATIASEMQGSGFTTEWDSYLPMRAE